MFQVLKKSLFLLLILAFAGCNAYQKVAYMQEAGAYAEFSDSIQAPIPDPVIKIGMYYDNYNTTTPEADCPLIFLVPAGETSRTYSEAITPIFIRWCKLPGDAGLYHFSCRQNQAAGMTKPL